VDRTEFLLQGVDRETAYGIEVGPFYSPIAPKAQGWHTTVVDFTDQNALVETVRTHTAAQIRALVDKIEPVDVVWRDVQLDKACLRLRPEGFDYLIASYVIEHIPDLISFLQQVSSLARPGFVLSLAVPDCRLSFDFFRPVSTTAEALSAYREKRTIHTPKTLFDAHAFMVHQNGEAVWVRGRQGQLKLVVPLKEAHQKYTTYARALQDRTQSYVDAHCWIFTPSSFELVILELNELGYIDFLVTDVKITSGAEFLTRCESGPMVLRPMSSRNAGSRFWRQSVERLLNRYII